MVSGLIIDAAIDGADHACTLDLPILADRDLRNLGHVAAEAEDEPRHRGRVQSGRGWPQPAFSAARSSTALARGDLPSKARRYSTGSFFAAAASSSMNLSTTKTLCVAPTPRHQPVVSPGRFVPDVFDPQIGEADSGLDCAFDGVAVQAVLEGGRRPAGDDRRADRSGGSTPSALPSASSRRARRS